MEQWQEASTHADEVWRKRKCKEDSAAVNRMFHMLKKSFDYCKPAVQFGASLW